MKHATHLFIIFLLVNGLTSCQSLRQRTKRHSPESTISIERGTQKLSLTYSRPYKKGRLIFGEKSEGALIPYGSKWRTGANEATQITFAETAWIQGKELPAGTYTLYSIPDKDSWTIAFNSRIDYWGASLSSPFKEAFDALRVEVPVENRADVTEQFTIAFEDRRDGIAMVLSWDQTRVAVLME